MSSSSSSSSTVSDFENPKPKNDTPKEEKLAEDEKTKKPKKRGNFDALLDIKLTEGDEDLFDNDGTDCGICLLFKAGGCKKETIPYDRCLKEAKTVEDLLKCAEFEKNLADCMLTKPAYYAPLMQALHAMGMRNLSLDSILP